jgi:hypothetical protein
VDRMGARMSNGHRFLLSYGHRISRW